MAGYLTWLLSYLWHEVFAYGIGAEWQLLILYNLTTQSLAKMAESTKITKLVKLQVLNYATKMCNTIAMARAGWPPLAQG